MFHTHKYGLLLGVVTCNIHIVPVPSPIVVCLSGCTGLVWDLG
jgi:hypothetical protein